MRRGIACASAVLGVLVAAPPAGALQHLMSIQEAYPGSAANPDSEFVELQMYSSSQSFVQSHPVRFYSATGAQTASATFSAAVANGQNQRSILIATTAAQAEFGVAPDLVINAGLDPAGGAACWDTFDCVSWGSFSGTLPSSAGTPAPAIPDAASLCRSIAAGSPSTLEAGDDTNNSAKDFVATPPAPRNNTAPAVGTPCPGEVDADPPKTEITKAPRRKSENPTARFKFRSSEQGSSFECKLDKKPFKECDSPQKYQGLEEGKHRFKVRATDAAGNTDPTPAKHGFKVLD